MEIKEVKTRLPLLEVVAHYGLRPDKHHRLLCPFHDDKTPSLQLYPKTDTFCCFSTEKLARLIAERLEVGSSQVIQALGAITDQLERYRLQQNETRQQE